MPRIRKPSKVVHSDWKVGTHDVLMCVRKECFPQKAKVHVHGADAAELGMGREGMIAKRIVGLISPSYWFGIGCPPPHCRRHALVDTGGPRTDSPEDYALETTYPACRVWVGRSLPSSSSLRCTPPRSVASPSLWPPSWSAAPWPCSRLNRGMVAGASRHRSAQSLDKVRR